MAIQQVNLGATGTGAGGDSARTAFEKLNANFSNPAHAANRLAQTSATDTTAGAVATTEGARFAVLANFGNYYPASVGKNIDTLVGGESGLFSTSSPGTFPPGFGIFVYIETQQTYSGSSVVQEACDYGRTFAPLGRRAFRVRSTGGEWSAWHVHCHSGNILGTVSQSGGVPTGAIIERGSNANGEYVRFADGTQVCFTPSAGLAASYVNASYLQALWAYPAGFIAGTAVPYLTPGAAVVTNIKMNRAVPQGQAGATGSATLRLFATGTDAFASGESATVWGFAIGRWY